MKKKLSILLTLCMILTLLPQSGLTAFAATTGVTDFTTLQSAIASAHDGDTIEIQAPINITATLTISESLTLTASDAGKLTRDNGFTSGSMFNINGSGKTVTFQDITIDGNNVVASDVGIGVDAGDLIFNSGAVLKNCNSTTNGAGVVIKKDCTFVINDGSITGNTTNNNGGGVLVCAGAFFTMNGGIISGNTSSTWGGGVVISDTSTFTMNGGIISENTSSTWGGGGVIVGGIFIMNGGSITKNSALWGGGVGVIDKYTFIMNGGIITNNTASESIGGGGVYIGSNCTAMLSNNVQISDNHRTDGNHDNVYLESGTLNLTGALANTAAIGVTMKNTPTSGNPAIVVVSDGGYIGGVTSDDAAKFTSDNASYHTGYDSVNQNVVLATPPVAVAITETAQTATYNGSHQDFAITGTPSIGFTIIYKQGGSVVMPTNVGTYDVEITRSADVSYNAFYKTIPGGLTINKDTPTINKPPIAEEIFVGAALSTSTLTGGLVNVPGTFSWTNGSNIPAVGTNSYSVTFTPSDTANYNTVTTNVAITVPTAPAIGAIPSQLPLYAGVDLNNMLIKPAIMDNGFLIEKQGWQSSADGTTGWQDIPSSSICTAGMNGYYLRYYVCYKPSSSGDLTVVYSPNTSQLTINRYTATLTLTVTPASPQVSGTAVTLNAAISGSSSVLTSQGYLNTVPVTFKDGTTTLGTATITAASGSAIFTTSALSIGNHTLTAEFPGESDYYAPATSNGVNYTIQVDPDIAVVAAATTNAAIANYSNMTQAVATSETVITDALKATAVTAVSGSGVTITINKINYTAPTVGTSANPSGTSGSYTFTITVSKGSQSQTTEQMSISILATTYTGGNSGGNDSPASAPVQSGKGKVEGTVEKDQQQSDGAPAASVNNSGAELKVSVLTPEEQKMVALGENVRVILKVVDISALVSAKEKQLIDETLNLTNSDTSIPALYVDLSLYKQVGNREQTRITETKDKISVSIEVPKSLLNTDVKKTRSFYIIRIHENEASRIDGTYDLATNLFTFETDRFSTYALTYRDVNTASVDNDDNTTNQLTLSQNFNSLRLTAKAAKNTQALTYVKVSGADGYLIYGAKCGQKLMKLDDVDKTITSYTVKNLKPATYYKYQVKAYKMINGKQVILSTSKVVHSVTTSKIYVNPTKVTSNAAAVKLATGQSITVSCKVVLPEGKKQDEHTAVIRYESSNKVIATVNSKGKMIAKVKGTCYVYAYAQNGVFKKIKVTVE